ncbi:MAG: hypothetical protein HY362_00025 [Candidatus Aenigmarchaeota archaeon]|nr:hypothetical protein [Candidatus Aenigmarchaeota archaeon]
MYARHILLGLILTSLFLALPAAAVKPICIDFYNNGESHNSMYWTPSEGTKQAPTDYDPFSSGLGISCANDWHYADVDGDGTVEAYLLTGENFTTWFTATVNGATNILGQSFHVSSFDIIAFDENWNNGFSYGCVDNTTNTRMLSQGFCRSETENSFVEKTYSNPQAEIRTPPIFGYFDMSLQNVGGHQWFAHGWASFTPKYNDTNTGKTKPYMVLNCGVDSDCGGGYNCIKPTFNPVDNFCEYDFITADNNKDGYRTSLKTDNVEIVPNMLTDNIIPSTTDMEVCKLFTNAAPNSKLYGVTGVGFNQGTSKISAAVYSDNSGKIGTLLAKGTKYISTNGVHEETIILNRVDLPEKFWACLGNGVENANQGFLAFSESGEFAYYYNHRDESLTRAHYTRKYAIRTDVITNPAAVADYKPVGYTEVILPNSSSYSASGGYVTTAPKELCKPLNPPFNGAELKEVIVSGFDGRSAKRTVQIKIYDDNKNKPGILLSRLFKDIEIGSYHNESFILPEPILADNRIWICTNTPYYTRDTNIGVSNGLPDYFFNPVTRLLYEYINPVNTAIFARFGGIPVPHESLNFTGTIIKEKNLREFWGYIDEKTSSTLKNGVELCNIVGINDKNAAVTQIRAAGFNGGDINSKILKGTVRLDNGGVPGNVIGTDYSNYSITGDLHGEIVNFKTPVPVAGNFWVCLSAPDSKEETYFAYYRNGGSSSVYYYPEGGQTKTDNDVQGSFAIDARVAVYSSEIKVIPNKDIVYENIKLQTENSDSSSKLNRVIPDNRYIELCKAFETNEKKAELTEVSTLGFTPETMRQTNLFVYADNAYRMGTLLYYDSFVNATIANGDERIFKLKYPVAVGNRFWVCMDVHDSNQIGELRYTEKQSETFISGSAGGDVSVRNEVIGKDYALRATIKVPIVLIKSSEDNTSNISYPFSIETGNGGRGENDDNNTETALAVSLIGLLVIGTAVAFTKQTIRGFETKLSELKQRVVQIFPTEKDSITPSADNNAIRRNVAGRYLAGFGNVSSVRYISEWLPGGYYFNIKQKYGDNYANKFAQENEERIKKELQMIRETEMKNAVIGSTVKSGITTFSGGLGDILSKEFRGMKRGESKNIVYNGNVYRLQKNDAGEESFYNVADQTAMQSLASANTEKLANLIPTLPYSKPIVVGRDIFKVVDFQPTMWGLPDHGTVKIYRGNYGDVNLELREFSDGTLTLERDYVDPRPEKAFVTGNILLDTTRLLSNWINHIISDVLKINRRDVEQGLTNDFFGQKMPYKEGTNKNVDNELGKKIVKKGADWTVEKMTEHLSIGTIAKLVLNKAVLPGVDILGSYNKALEDYNSGRKNLGEAAGDFARETSLDIGKDVAVHRIYKNRIEKYGKIKLPGGKINPAGLKAFGVSMGWYAAFETFGWGISVFSDGTRVQKFMEEHPTLMEDFDRLIVKANDAGEALRTVNELRKLAAAPDAPEEVKRYLKQRESELGDSLDAQQQILDMWSKYGGNLENMEEFLRGRTDGLVGGFSNLLKGGKNRVDYDNFKKKLDEIKEFVDKARNDLVNDSQKVRNTVLN